MYRFFARIVSSGRLVMIPLLVSIVILLLGGASGSATLHSGGEIDLLPIGGEGSVSFGLQLPGGGWEAHCGASISGMAWEELTLGLSGSLSSAETSCLVVFAPQSASISFAQSAVWVDTGTFRIEGLGRLEPTGAGVGFCLANLGDSSLETLNLRFNLKHSLDEVQDGSFCLPFSYGEIAFHLPAPEGLEDLLLAALWSNEGFEGAWLSFLSNTRLIPGVQLAGTLNLRSDAEELMLYPSLSYSSPPDLELFVGLDWDESKSSFNGFLLYGLGFTGELGIAGLSALASFAEDSIDLVEDPYSGKLSLGFPVPGVGSELQVVLSAFFHEESLFGLGKLGWELSSCPAPSVEVELSGSLTSQGILSLSVGWHVDVSL